MFTSQGPKAFIRDLLSPTTGIHRFSPMARMAVKNAVSKMKKRTNVPSTLPKSNQLSLALYCTICVFLLPGSYNFSYPGQKETACIAGQGIISQAHLLNMVLELLHISLLLGSSLPPDLTTSVRRRWEAQSTGNDRSTGPFAGRRLNSKGMFWQWLQHSSSSHTSNKPCHNVFVLCSGQGAGRVDNDSSSLRHPEPVHQKAALKIG